ncbi:MAG TPA: hypothetical protein VK176_05965 [Phycisphaerales bacterium]|nr:hypothetical protein [Phycisphaerales bacterium]
MNPSPRTSILRAATLAACLLLTPACTSYYKVTDPASEKSYYTKKKVDSRDNGAITFKDEKSGANVTLQSSEVHKITKEEFEQATADSKKR